MCDKSRNIWLCVHWQWNTLEWCQLNALQASPVVHLVTPLSCVSLSMNTQPSVPAIWTSYQIHKIAGCACAGNAGNVFPRRRFQRKLLVIDPGMHHGTCVTHVPWCMSGSLTCSDGKTFPAFPAHAHPQFCVSGKRPIEWWCYLPHPVPSTPVD